jgi:hypothetical protein
VGETTVLLAASIATHAPHVATVMIALAGLIVTLLVEHLAVIVMTGHVLLIVTLVHHAVSIAIHVHLVATAMIVLAGLIVMLLVAHLAVIVTTGHVLLIATLVHHAASIATRVHLVATVKIVLAGLIVTRALHALQRKNVQMKLKVALANVAQAAKCHCHQNVLVKTG